VDLTAFFIGLFGFLKLLTFMAFILAIVFIKKMGGGRRWRSRDGHRGAGGEDQAILDDIARVAEKMDQRLEALEKILETDDPKWKERAR
jgi:phage shock protein B